MLALKRIKKELEIIKNEKLENISVDIINENDLFKWQVTMKGPEDSPYKDQIFNLGVVFPDDYPFSPPKCTFITKIIHPNIDINGNISLNILLKEWNPTLNISKVLQMIYSLLSSPIIDDNLNIEKKKVIVHRRYSSDIILSRVQSHYMSFIVYFLNDILRNLNFNQRFLKLRYHYIGNIKRNFIKSLKKKTLSEIICNNISPKYIHKIKNYNKELYEKIRENDILSQILDENYYIVFKTIYLRNIRTINLKKYGLNQEIILSNNVPMFEDLLKKVSDSQYIDKINKCINIYCNY